MKLNQKTLRAGNLVSVVEYSRPLPKDSPRQRAEKHRATTDAQRRLNNKTLKGKLAFLLAANFLPGKDYFITLTYAAGQEPKDRTTAKKNEQAFIRKLRKQRRQRGLTTKYISTVESRHDDGRYHHHMVINSTDIKRDVEDLLSLWTFGSVDIRILFDKTHRKSNWLSVARYLTKERPEDGPDLTPVGARVFSCSRNLYRPKPEYRIIDDAERAELPPGAEMIDGDRHEKIVDGVTIEVRALMYITKTCYEPYDDILKKVL